MIKLKWVIAYHGAAYQGWQAQKTGRGVQSVLEEVLQRFCPLASRLCGSSRTDTGVHAMGMVAHVELPKSQVTDASPEKNDLKMVEVDPSGNYFLETQPVSLSTLQEALAAAFEQNPDLVLVIRGDLGATWGNIYAVLDGAKKLGMQNIYFRHEMKNP